MQKILSLVPVLTLALLSVVPLAKVAAAQTPPLLNANAAAFIPLAILRQPEPHIHAVGRIELSELVASAKQIEFTATSLSEVASLNGDLMNCGRISAHWQNGSRGRARAAATKVRYYPNHVGIFKKQIAALALHELLMSKGCKDQRSWVTMSLYLMTDPRYKQLPSQFRETIEKAVNVLCPVDMAGSVVAGGGGGEAAELWVRMRYIENAMAAYFSSPDPNDEDKLARLESAVFSTVSVSYLGAGDRCR